MKTPLAPGRITLYICANRLPAHQPRFPDLFGPDLFEEPDGRANKIGRPVFFRDSGAVAEYAMPDC
jgi:hypothetical protein